jgi:hypothetical protein
MEVCGARLSLREALIFGSSGTNWDRFYETPISAEEVFGQNFNLEKFADKFLCPFYLYN